MSGQDGHQSRNRAITAFIAVLALTGFGGLVWYAYTWSADGMGRDELPLVMAEEGPEKHKPPEPGGMRVPYQDKLVLNERDPSKVRTERLLPPPEEPLEPAPLEAPETAGNGGGVRVEMVEIEKLRTEARPLEDEAAEPAAEEELAEREIAVIPQRAPREERRAAAPAEPESAPREQPAPQPAAEGSFSVQIAAVRERSGAEAEWRRLRQEFASVLRDKRLVIEKATVGGDTFFRLQASAFRSRESAEEACNVLKSRNQGCLVTTR